jgi:hypothetical protein
VPGKSRAAEFVVARRACRRSRNHGPRPAGGARAATLSRQIAALRESEAMRQAASSGRNG